MDLEVENRIAAILLKEAVELRRQADKEGVHVYLEKRNVRGRPNSRFLTATVLGVQQANRAVEVNEMWRVRQKELELNDRLKGRSKDVSSSGRSHRDSVNSSRSASRRHDDNASASCSSAKKVAENCYSREDEGLRDEEVEEFLNSRIKRGRGSIGSRMDETGPYLPADDPNPPVMSTSPTTWERRVMLGPEKPSTMKSYRSSSDEEFAEKSSPLNSDESSSDEDLHEHRRKKKRKVHSGSSDKKHSKKHKSKEKSRKKREEKRSKHRR